VSGDVHALVDLVADRPDLLDALAGRVRQLPVEVALAREDGARVTAAQRDDHVRRLDHLVRQRLGELHREIDADLDHRGDHGRVDLIGRSAARRAHLDAALRVVVEEPRRHLATAGVVDADEEDLRTLLHHERDSFARVRR
jgi:hypothetical protein